MATCRLSRLACGYWMPKASCAILDTEAGCAEVLRVDYDVEAVCERIKTHDLPERLCQRLRRGA
jgi:hypothetical protein